MHSRHTSPEVSPQTSFERIINISTSLGNASIHHDVVSNDLGEPLALYVPGLMTPEEAGTTAQQATDVLFPKTDDDWESFDTHWEKAFMQYTSFRGQRTRTVQEALATIGKEGIILPSRLERMVPFMMVKGTRSQHLYSWQVSNLVDTVVEGLSINRPFRLAPLGQYWAQELGGGDSFPHFDYPQDGDIMSTGRVGAEGLTPNIHITLRGTGIVSVAPVRDPLWVTTLRDGIKEAFQAGMTQADINNNFTSKLIAEADDRRLPDSFRRGVDYLETAMETYASPYIRLNTGDAFIFDGCQQGRCLPVVHDFHTLKMHNDPEKDRRMFAVIRPEVVSTRHLHC